MYCYIINGNVCIIIVVLTFCCIVVCVCVCVLVGFYGVVYFNVTVLYIRFTA